jgi:3-oxoacyl-[acyl-carrier protein] reductase
MVKRTVERYGRIDVLVNNTGGPLSSRFLETTEDHWQRAIDALFLSVVNRSREVIPFMRQNAEGPNH